MSSGHAGPQSELRKSNIPTPRNNAKVTEKTKFTLQGAESKGKVKQDNRTSIPVSPRKNLTTHKNQSLLSKESAQKNSRAKSLKQEGANQKSPRYITSGLTEGNAKEMDPKRIEGSQEIGKLDSGSPSSSFTRTRSLLSDGAPKKEGRTQNGMIGGKAKSTMSESCRKIEGKTRVTVTEGGTKGTLSEGSQKFVERTEISISPRSAKTQGGTKGTAMKSITTECNTRIENRVRNITIEGRTKTATGQESQRGGRLKSIMSDSSPTTHRNADAEKAPEVRAKVTNVTAGTAPHGTTVETSLQISLDFPGKRSPDGRLKSKRCDSLDSKTKPGFLALGNVPSVSIKKPGDTFWNKSKTTLDMRTVIRTTSPIKSLRSTSPRSSVSRQSGLPSAIPVPSFQRAPGRSGSRQQSVDQSRASASDETQPFQISPRFSPEKLQPLKQSISLPYEADDLDHSRPNSIAVSEGVDIYSLEDKISFTSAEDVDQSHSTSTALPEGTESRSPKRMSLSSATDKVRSPGSSITGCDETGTRSPKQRSSLRSDAESRTPRTSTSGSDKTGTQSPKQRSSTLSSAEIRSPASSTSKPYEASEESPTQRSSLRSTAESHLSESSQNRSDGTGSLSPKQKSRSSGSSQNQSDGTGSLSPKLRTSLRPAADDIRTPESTTSEPHETGTESPKPRSSLRSADDVPSPISSTSKPDETDSQSVKPKASQSFAVSAPLESESIVPPFERSSLTSDRISLTSVLIRLPLISSIIRRLSPFSSSPATSATSAPITPAPEITNQLPVKKDSIKSEYEPPVILTRDDSVPSDSKISDSNKIPSESSSISSLDRRLKSKQSDERSIPEKDFDFFKIYNNVAFIGPFEDNLCTLPGQMTLYVPPEELMLLYDTANCAATEAYMKMRNIDFSIEYKINAEHMSPSGRVPFTRCGPCIVSEFEPIVSFINWKSSESSGIKEKDLPTMKAFMAMVNGILDSAERYICWHDQTALSNHSKPRTAARYPSPLNYYLSWKKMSEERRRLLVQGKSFKSIEAVLREISICCRHLSEELGKNKFFFGDKYCEFDALVYGHMFALLTVRMEGPAARLQQIVRQYQNLVTFVKDIDQICSLQKLSASKVRGRQTSTQLASTAVCLVY